MVGLSWEEDVQGEFVCLLFLLARLTYQYFYSYNYSNAEMLALRSAEILSVQIRLERKRLYWQ